MFESCLRNYKTVSPLHFKVLAVFHYCPMTGTRVLDEAKANGTNIPTPYKAMQLRYFYRI